MNTQCVNRTVGRVVRPVRLAIAAVVYIGALAYPQSTRTWVLTSDTDFTGPGSSFLFTQTTGTGVGASITLSSAPATWWNSNWDRKLPVFVFNYSTRALSGYPALITFSSTQIRGLYQAGKLKADGSDLRFLTADDSTVLPYWIESISTFTAIPTRIWVRVPSIPAASAPGSPGYVYIFMYSANPAATPVSNIRGVFDFADDFESGLSSWTIIMNGAAGTAVAADAGGPMDEGNNTSSKTASNVLRLTNNTANVAAVAIPNGVSLPLGGSWKAMFKYKVTNNNGQPDGGEGFTFMFYKDVNRFSSNLPDTGSRLGFTAGGANVTGYGVEFDAVENTGESLLRPPGSGMTTPTGPHIGMLRDTWTPSLYVYDGIDVVRNERWYSVEVAFVRHTTFTANGVVNVYTESAGPVPFHRVKDYPLPSAPAWSGLGFSAATSTNNTNQHLIDDFVLRKYEETIFIGGDGKSYRDEAVLTQPASDEMPKTTGASSGEYTSPVFICSSFTAGTTVYFQTVVHRVSWNATTPSSTSVKLFVRDYNRVVSSTADWVPVNNGQDLLGYRLATWYIQIGARFEAIGTQDRPLLHDVTVRYKTKPWAYFTARSTYNPAVDPDRVRVDFDGTVSLDLDGDIDQWIWDFGDGAAGYGSRPSHSYLLNPGGSTYTVRLAVSDTLGFTNEYSNSFYINPFEIPPPSTGTLKLAPVAFLTASPTVVRNGKQFLLDASGSYDADSGIGMMVWSTYIGTHPVTGEPIWLDLFASSQTTVYSRTAYFTYITTVPAGALNPPLPAPYVYTVSSTHVYRVAVYDSTQTLPSGERLYSVAFATIVVQMTPAALFSADRTLAPYGTPVVFDGSASNYPGGPIKSFLWDFGDGTTSTEPVVTHLFPLPGTPQSTQYKPTLTITTYDGQSDSTAPVTITLSYKPVADLLFKRIVSTGEVVTLDARGSRDPDAEPGELLYLFGFGDGSANVSNRSGVAQQTYRSAGDYTVFVRVTDRFGFTDEKSFTITVVTPDVGGISEQDAWNRRWDEVLDRAALNVFPMPAMLGRQTVRFGYYLEADRAGTEVFLQVSDLMGRVVLQRRYPSDGAGARAGWWNIVEWDGRDPLNEWVPSGVYVGKLLLQRGNVKTYRTLKFAVLRTE